MMLDAICAVAMIAKVLPARAPPVNAAVGAIEGLALLLDSSATLRRVRNLVRRAYLCGGIWPGSGVACGGGF